MDNNNVNNIHIPEFGDTNFTNNEQFEEFSLDDMSLDGDLLGTDLDSNLLNDAIDVNNLMNDDQKYKCYCIDVALSKKTVPIYLTAKQEILSKFVVQNDFNLEEGSVCVLPMCTKVENIGLLNKLVSTYGSKEVDVSVNEIKDIYEKNKFEVTHINLQLSGGGLHA